MYQVFNMGIGMVAIVSPNDAAAIGKQLRARVIGRIERGKGVVQFDSAGEVDLNVEFVNQGRLAQR